ncbi:YceI family protein [Acidisoma silvae]|uniref:YceI family protein n=2 Tax=Acidisoma silvae TaxID=2802396 RepID=A0A963YRW6_9PROT|nr:YceI family protein [Acidisoma silvae]
MYRSLGLAAALLVGASIAAPISAYAATWTIDTAKSTLGFTGSQSGTPFNGKFGKFSGTIVFDPANPGAGHADVIIQTASAATGDQQKDGAMPGSDWFAADKFPTAEFKAASFKAIGTGTYEADGTLTIRGMTKPIALPFTLAITGDTATAKGKVQLIRTNYGVGQGAWASAQYVALEVAVNVDITAEKTAP